MKLSLNAPVRRQRAFVLAVVFLMLASSLGAQAPGRRSGRDVHLGIETDRPTYHVGDSITVRLTLHNVSPLPVRFANESATGLARLRVYDAAGHQVDPAGSGLPARGGGPSVTLNAGGEATLKGWQSQEWLNLRDWGYDLRTPGRYTIVGLPGVVGPELTPDYETVRSNRATFTILP